MGISDCCGECCRKFGRMWYTCFIRWRLWLRPFVVLAYCLVLLVLVPFLVLQCVGECSSREQIQLIGGIFSLLALPITFWQISQHLVHYTKPYLQKHVIRILWMVPIYSMDAWLGLIEPRISIYMNSLRECYESYVIYNFMKFLLNYLNGEMDLEANLELKPQVHHLIPLCWLRDWEMGAEFVHKCKHGILQYTIIRPIMAAIAFICEMANVYGEDQYSPTKAYPYIMVVNNLSQFVSMYCLVLFYKANRTELGDMKPIGKFLCIKSVVFFSFFQEFLISILANLGVISNIFGITDSRSTVEISSTLQNFLICIEMFLAAIAHKYFFSYKDYVDMAAATPNCCESFMSMWDVSDVKDDFAEHVGVVRNTVIRNVMPSKVYRHPGGLTEERARLLSISDGVDYQSGNENGPGSSAPVTRGPFQTARSASLSLIGEVDPSITTAVVATPAQASAKNPSGSYDAFTDLSEYDKVDQSQQRHY